MTLVLGCALLFAGHIGGGAQAQPLPHFERGVAPDEVSSARRWGARRAWARTARRNWAAQHGNRHHAGRWHRHDDHNEPSGDDRPDVPGSGPKGQPRPDPTGHVTRHFERDDGAPRPPRPPLPDLPRDHDPRPLPAPPVAQGEPGSGPGLCIAGRVREGRCECAGDQIRMPLDRGVTRCLDRSSLVARVPTSLGGFGARNAASPRDDRTPQTPNARPPALGALDPFVPDEVLVTVPRAVPESVDDAVGQSLGLQLFGRRTIGLLDARVLRFRIPDGRSVSALVTALRADQRLLDPQPNYYYRPQQDRSPENRSLGLQYALAKIDAVRAQALARGRCVRVAVLDSGADETHPDIASAIVESFDAVGAPASETDPHGTAIASIVAANGILRGVAPEAQLLNVRAFAPAGPDRASAGTTFDLLRGIEWALKHGARVLNMSFTGPRDTLLERGIAAAGERGAIVVAAAGNAGANAPPAYPAAYPSVIAVTATDSADRRYRLANRGSYIALAAPGVDILAASTDHAHQLVSGTSFAAAHVSGIVALMIERDPALTAEAARRALTAAAEDLGPPGPDDQYGAGRANALAALGALAGH